MRTQLSNGPQSVAIAHHQHSSTSIASTGRSYIKRHLNRSNDLLHTQQRQHQPSLWSHGVAPIKLGLFEPIQGRNYTVTSTRCSVCALLLFVCVLQWNTRLPTKLIDKGHGTDSLQWGQVLPMMQQWWMECVRVYIYGGGVLTGWSKRTSRGCSLNQTYGWTCDRLSASFL